MSEHQARVQWNRGEDAFTGALYSRTHTWSFDGGASFRASASPANVRVPLSDPSLVDPEETFVASLASCHMLVFLHVAALRGLVVDAYDDAASGYLLPMEDGRLVLGRIVLRPAVTFSPTTRATPSLLSDLHLAAHHGCFLANAVRSEITIEPRPASAPQP
jgi:organic hydroperoxide reductase OsmC/OhrA